MSDERRPSSRTAAGRSTATTSAASRRAGGSSEASARAAELRRLVQKKERLKYAVERLELQGRQRERELRKSMAVPQ